MPFTPELEHLIRRCDSHVGFAQLVQQREVKDQLQRVLLEYRNREKLERHGMSYRRKILLAGPPGTGKTMTASILATELKLPLYRVQLDKVVTKFMGETSAKLRLVFEEMRERKGVYLFDEFDTIGGERSSDNDVGEMRRVLNSFLQFIENDPSDSLIVCATNNPSLLDQALFRRFDDVLVYAIPDAEGARELMRNRTAAFIDSSFDFDKVIGSVGEMSHADITRACDDAIKLAILGDSKYLAEELLKSALEKRKSVRKFILTRV